MFRLVFSLDLTTSLKKLLLIPMTFGIVTLVLGFVHAPQRIWPNLLISICYVTGIGLGGGLFLASQHVASAGWSVAIRRIPEAMTSLLPVAGIGALSLIFGVNTLYEWSQQSVVARDQVLQAKSPWLNEPFFISRVLVYFLLWTWMSRAMVNNSILQDLDRNIMRTRRNVRNAALFIVVGIGTSYFASVDLLMSLEPHWYSTMFGLLVLAGMALSGLAMITVFVILLRRLGHGNLFGIDHLHALGGLMVAFSSFWAYLWICQHLLIWYANIPEETSYYVVRHSGGWGWLSVLNIALNWLVPFLMLLPRTSKRSERVMLRAAVLILIGHWLDLYITVMPAKFGNTPPFGIWEVGLLAGTMALSFWVVLRVLCKRNLIPLGDPFLVESLPQAPDET